MTENTTYKRPVTVRVFGAPYLRADDPYARGHMNNAEADWYARHAPPPDKKNPAD